MDVPALATTSPDGTPVAQAGVLGPGTSILFGDTGLNDEARSGGRFTLGLWLDPCRFTGLDITYLALGDESETFAGSNTEFTILARPFLEIDPANPGQNARLIVDTGVVGGPGVVGTLDIEATTEFQTFELLFRRAAVRSCGSRVDYLMGYRFAELKDRARVDESTLSLTAPTLNWTFDLFDQSESRNTFHGAEFGVAIERQTSPCWSLGLLVKVAIGGTKAANRHIRTNHPEHGRACNDDDASGAISL